MEETKKHDNLALKIAPFVSAVALIAYVISVCVSSVARPLMSNIMFAVAIAVANFIVVRAYLAYNKNTVKSLLGFILCGIVMLSMHFAFYNFDPTSWSCNVKAIMFLMICVFTVNQCLLSNDHASRPVVLFINQVLMDLVCIISIVATVINFVQSKDSPFIFATLLIFVICTMFIVLDIEMKVDDAKVKRAEKGFVFVKSTATDDLLEDKDMFISNKLFYALPWIVLVGLVGLFVFDAIFDSAITWGYSIRYLFYVLKILALIVAITSYKSHDKNVRKIMMGFLLGMLLFENIFEITFLPVNGRTLKSALTMALLPFAIFFLIAHLQLVKTHSSKTSVVKLMKIVYVVYIVCAVLVAVGCSVYYFIGKGNNFVFFMFKPILWLLGTIPVVTAVLAIDTRVNGFKVRRENMAENKGNQ